MTANSQCKVYIKCGRSTNSYDEEILGTKKSAVNKKITRVTLWTDIKGQRVNLDIFLESILLNGSLKHIALSSHLMSDNK
jgi:hypothetical protein